MTNKNYIKSLVTRTRAWAFVFTLLTCGLMSLNTLGQSTPVLGSEGFANGTNPTGWANGASWVLSNATVSSGYTNPISSGTYNYRYQQNGTAADVLTSPSVNFSCFTAGVIKFGLIKSSASFTRDLVISVDINNAGTYAAFTQTILNANIPLSWTLQTISLGAAINNNSQVKIRFSVPGTGTGTPNMRIDDITLFGTPTIPTPVSIPSSQSFETWSTACGYTTGIPSAAWVASPATGDNSWRRNDQGSSANWSSTNGLYSPVFSNGAASARFHTYDASVNAVGALDLYVNATSQPAGGFLLSYDYINSSGTDNLSIQYSTNSGSSFTNIETVTTATVWTTRTVTVPSNSANVVIRFLAKGDFGTTDIGLDNVVLAAIPACTTPTAVAAGSVTSTTASITWTCASCSGTYSIDYGSNGHAAGTGTIINGVTSPYTLNPPLTASTAYTVYIRQDCSGGGNGLSSWSSGANFTTLATPPANDECATAVVLTQQPNGSCTTTSGTVAGATNSGITACTGTPDDDVWYVFNATATTAIINRTTASSWDSGIEIFNSTGASPGSCIGTSRACQDAETAFTVTGLTIGLNYYIRMYSWSSAFTPSTPTFTICVTSNPPPPANDECATAVVLTHEPNGSCTTTSGTVASATNSGITACTGTPDDDVWYRFVATATTAIINRTTASSWDSGIEVFNSTGASPGTCIGTSRGCQDAESAFTVTGLTVGLNYYIRMYSWSSAFTPSTPTFTICVTAPVACAVPTSLAAGSITSTTASITWTCTGCTGTYSLDYGANGHAAGTGTIINGITSPYTLNPPLTASTAYTIYIRQDCSGGGNGVGAWSAAVNFTTLAPPPANDICSGAEVIPTSGPFPYTTPVVTAINNATNTNDPTNTCQANSNKGVWYTFTPNLTGSYIISSCSGDVATSTISDNVLSIFTSTGGCAGPFTQIACDDDGCSTSDLQAVITTTLTSGTTYYILGYGYNTNVGNMALKVTAPVACPVPTALAAGSITATTASITWTCTGCTGTYSLDYGANGHAAGTGTIINNITSPYTLNPPLTSSTAYTIYIRQDCSGGGNGVGAWSAGVNFTTLAPPPANDDCAGATPLTVNATCITTAGNGASASQSIPAILCDGFTGNADDDMWYSFVASNTTATITVDGGSDYDAVVELRSGACNGASVSCADATTADGIETINATGLTIGATYYVRVYDYAAGSGSFTICVTGTCATPSAYAVTGGGNYCAGSTPPSVGLANSTIGFNYQLSNGSPVGSPVAGTGSAITFGSQSAGTYTVTAINAGNSSCTTPMTGSVTVTVEALPTGNITSANTAVCTGGTAFITGNVTATGNWTVYLTEDGNTPSQSGTGNGSFNISVTPGSTTTYVITALETDNCEAAPAGMTGSTTVTVNAYPDADDPADVTACDSYSLPALSVGNYFTGSGGTGTALTAGNSITSTQTIYVYAETGTTPNCTDENSFVVTINNTPNADDPADVVSCGPYTLPALTVGNYFTGSGGTGTALSAGNSISSSQTIYVYAETGTTPNCTDENSFTVTINTAPVVTITSANHSICSGNSTNISGTVSATGAWSLNLSPSGSATGTGNGTFSVLVGPLTNTTTYTLASASDATGCPATLSGSTVVTVISAPITGSVSSLHDVATNTTIPSACSGQIMEVRANGNLAGTGLQYGWSKGSSSGNLLFSTSASGPWSGTLATTGNTVFVQFGALVSGYSGYRICVQGFTFCQSTLNFCPWIQGTVNTSASITGPTVVCPPVTQSYTAAAVAGAFQYRWTFQPDAGAVQLLTVGTPVENLSIPSYTTSAKLCVTAELACGAGSGGAPRCVTLVKQIAAVGPMTGNSPVCPGTTNNYSIAALAGATSYAWTSPGSFTNVTSTSINVTFPTPYNGSGQVCVTASGTCSTPVTRCKSITSSTPLVPASLTGPLAGVCTPATVGYTIPSVAGATGYTWTYPTGPSTYASVAGNTTFSFNAPAGLVNGTVSVVAENNNCTPTAVSGIRSIPVKGAPARPTSITTDSGPFNGCPTLFSTPFSSGLSYLWSTSLGAGAPIDPPNPNSSGQIVITWGTGTGTVNVTASNSCGSSGSYSQSFTGQAGGCRLAGETTIANSNSNFSVYPNPAYDRITVEMVNDKSENAVMRITDLSGRLISTAAVNMASGTSYTEVDLTHLAKGPYILTVENSTGVNRQRIVVE